MKYAVNSITDRDNCPFLSHDREGCHISVLIPVHDYKCYTLVEALHGQLEKAGVGYEIIVADDGSRDQVSIISNLLINDLTHCRYLRRKENVGRARIRNILAKEAKGEWLLFMDCDGKVEREDFIEGYIRAAGEGNLIICGGIKQPAECPDPRKSLRWRYEKDYEQRHGFVSDTFRSFCFMIRKDVFDAIRFDEKYVMYGWEDVQFGIDIRNKGYSVSTINNPLTNKDIETNEVFLRKTEESLVSLRKHYHILKDEVYLLTFIERLRRNRFLWLITLTYSMLRPVIRKNLLSSKPNLKLFALYKIGYYVTQK